MIRAVLMPPERFRLVRQPQKFSLAPVPSLAVRQFLPQHAFGPFLSAAFYDFVGMTKHRVRATRERAGAPPGMLVEHPHKVITQPTFQLRVILSLVPITDYAEFATGGALYV